VNDAGMMGYGAMGGGIGSPWVLILIVAVVIFVAAWILKQLGK
jgi:ABC-type multidrug transport system permease subunit